MKSPPEDAAKAVNERGDADMILDAGAIIALISLVATIVGAAFGAGVAVGKQSEKIERLDRKLEDQEHRNAHKNDRR